MEEKMLDHDQLSGIDLEKARAARLPMWGGPTPIILDHGLGASVWDIDGNEYIDCTSQAWTLNVGYCHPKVIQAVTEQMHKLTHVRMAFDTVPYLKLAKRLADLAPGNFAKIVGFSLHGSTAVETAMKQALRQNNQGSFISLYDAYHGRSFGGLALSWPHPNNAFLGFQGRVVRLPQAYCYRCPFDRKYPECEMQCLRFTEQAIDKAIDGHPIAFVMEPIQGNGGMIDFPKEYYSGIRRICTEKGILLIFDEIQTAFGRVGKMTAAELYQVDPDIIIFGKAIAGGFPLAGTIARADLKPMELGDSGYTFGEFPVSMAAALATLDIIDEEGLLERASRLGNDITSKLNELKDKYEMIGDIRGPGLMIGFELVKSKTKKEPAKEEARRFVAEGLKRGVMFGESKYRGLGNVIKIKPPLVISDGQIEKVMNVTEEILESMTHEEKVNRN
jgi:4-aminobutyrate aminotransferase/(S)-3-amino-2-methylpropionate transaminase